MATLTEEEEILAFDVSDEALEIAGSDKTNFTWGVCTLDQPGCFPPIFLGDQNTHRIAAEWRRLVASVSRSEDKQALKTLARAWDRLKANRWRRVELIKQKPSRIKAAGSGMRASLGQKGISVPSLPPKGDIIAARCDVMLCPRTFGPSRL